MFSSPKTSEAYKKVGVETGVMAANPHQLILMLYDGAQLAVAFARKAMQEGDIARKGEEISRTIDIIANGLNASLDVQAGGELAEHLDALYEYMCHRLLHANLRNDPAALDEVSHLLKELKEAWMEIAEDPAVVSFSTKAA